MKLVFLPVLERIDTYRLNNLTWLYICFVLSNQHATQPFNKALKHVTGISRRV